MLVSPALLSSTLFRVLAGMLANAELSGANTVMSGAELSVSTRPAFSTAVTSVDSTGLAEAAVATGAAAIPLKLPAPDLGTDEQPAPKSAAAAGLAIGAEVEAIGGADVEAPPELHAAAPMATLTASPDRASRRYFIFFLLRGSVYLDFGLS